MRSFLVCLCLTLAACRSVPVFNSRDVVDTRYELALAVMRSNPPAIDKDRSVLVTNRAVVEDDHFTFDPRPTPLGEPAQPWAFPKLLKDAFVRAGFPASSAEQNFKRMVDELTKPLVSQCGPEEAEQRGFVNFTQEWTKIDASTSLNNVPLRLLAILNRLDKARISTDPSCPVSDSGHFGLSGGELRFEFGGIDAAGKVTEVAFILEYPMKCLSKAQFGSLAVSWAGLPPIAQTANYTIALSTVIATMFANSSGELRFRSLTRPDVGGFWSVAQYQLAPSIPLNAHVLDRQICGRRTQVSDTPNPDCSHDPDVIDFVSKTVPIDADEYDVPAPLAVRRTLIGKADPFSVPPGTLTEDRRHRVALNLCVGCHVSETGNDGLHIQNRNRRAASAISKFLSGSAKTNLKPGCQRPPVTYTYADLDRRVEFLQAVLALNTGQATDAEWRAKLKTITQEH